MYYFLLACEEHQVYTLTKLRFQSGHAAQALADNILNLSKPGMMWLWGNWPKIPFTRAQGSYKDETFGAATEMFRLASEYITFQTIYTYASRDLLELQLHGTHISSSGIMRENTEYDAYDRLSDFLANSGQHVNLSTELILALHDSIQPTRNAFRLRLSRKLIDLALRDFHSVIAKRFKLPIDWDFPLFSLSDYRKVSSLLVAFSGLHLQARLLMIHKGCPALCIRNPFIEMARGELLDRLSAYSGLLRSRAEAVLSYMTYGEHGQTNPDPALQPVIPLGKTLALASSLVINSSLERNLAVLLNRIPDAKELYSKYNSEREEIMRNEIANSRFSSLLRVWHGDVPEWEKSRQIDLVLISDAERVCLVLELKSFIAPAEPSEIINRSEEIMKGIQQIDSRRKAFLQNATALFKKLGVTPEYTITWAVVSENSIGAQYVHTTGTPVVNRLHLQRFLERNPLSRACHWLENREYLPVKDRDYHETAIRAQVGHWTTDWYAIEILSTR